MAPRVPTNEANASAPRLPTEIVSHIVQDTRQGNDTWEKDIQSLCLVSKEFLNPSQAALFQNVTISPSSETVEGVKPKGPNQAVRFAEVISQGPELGQYVRALHYKLPRRIHDGTEATTSLARLTQLRTLQIEYECTTRGKEVYLDWTPQTSRSSRATQEKYRGLLGAFKKLFASHSLKELILKNISVPADMIMKATAVEKLWLDGAAHCFPIVTYDAPYKPILIKHLKLTGNAAFYMGSLVAPERSYPISFSDLLTLDMPFGDDLEEQAKEFILGQVTDLQELRLHTPENHLFDASGNLYTHEDPLRHLHAQAYTTLTTLCLDIKFDISDPSDVIIDPWQGLCCEHDNTLRKLKALQDLTITIWIGGSAWRHMAMRDSMHNNFWNPRWQKLDKVLLPLGPEGPLANPQLRRVEVVVGVYGDCGEAPKQTIDLFCAVVALSARVRPWLRGIMRKRKRGEVQAAIKTAVKHPNCGDDACPYMETLFEDTEKAR